MRSRSRVPLLEQDREPHRRAGGVFEHAVAIAVGEARRGQQLARPGRVVRVGGDVADVPRRVARGDRPEDRHRGAQVDGVGDRLAIDAEGQRLPELLAPQPGLADPCPAWGVRLNQRRSGIEADAAVEQPQPSLIGERA